MEPSLLVDVALPTTAVGIVLLVINTIANRVIEYRKTKNGGTEPVKTVNVLEEIARLTRDNGTKLEALKKISTDMESGIDQLQLYNTTSERVSTARREGHEAGREEGRVESNRERYRAQ